MRRVVRGLLAGMQMLRDMLQQLGADARMDYDEVDVDRLNLPYDLAMHNSIADADGDDRLDPDRERRDAEVRREFGANVAAAAADRAAFVEVAAEMARHSQSGQNKRRRLDNSSDLADMRLQLEQKSMECEEMRLQREEMRLQLEEERLQRVEERQQRDDMRRQMEDMRLELEELRSGRST